MIGNRMHFVPTIIYSPVGNQRINRSGSLVSDQASGTTSRYIVNWFELQLPRHASFQLDMRNKAKSKEKTAYVTMSVAHYRGLSGKSKCTKN